MEDKDCNDCPYFFDGGCMQYVDIESGCPRCDHCGEVIPDNNVAECEVCGANVCSECMGTSELRGDYICLTCLNKERRTQATQEKVHKDIMDDAYSDSQRIDEMMTADDYNRFEENQIVLDNDMACGEDY